MVEETVSAPVTNRFDRMEVAGAFGDLGTLVPFVVAYISVLKMDPFGVLLAFGAKGTPAVVMSIVFAGAPVVNAIVALIQHPPAGGWGTIRAPFWIGIILAVTGGALVTKFKPAPPAPKKPTAIAAVADAKATP